MYLFAANTKKREVDFACVLPGARGSADVLWEGRRVPVDAGGVSDRFAPYGVHVYRFRSAP